MRIVARAVVIVAFCASVVVPAVPAGAQSCDAPTVNTLVAAEAAVSRPAINSPSEIPLSSVYANLSQATKPAFVYAEAGPQFAGVFEALAPPEAPPPPRAVAGYPSEDVPDDDTVDWGGRSRAAVTSISAFAESTGSGPLGDGELTVDSSRSWVTSIVECDVVTVIAGWEANNVTVAPGSTVQQLGQVVTLVVGPDGASADVDTTVVGAEGFGEVPVEGRPLAPFADPTAENGGPVLDVGDPRTEASEDGASASGGGFSFLFLDPEAGQGAGYRIGSVNAQIDILGPLEQASPAPVEVTTTQAAPPTTAAAAVSAPPPTTAPARPSRPAATTVVGTPPPPSPSAVATAATGVLATDLTDITIRTTNWYPLIVAIGSLFLFAQVTAIIRVGRRWDPTLDWIVRHGDRLRERFHRTYLRW